MIQESILENLSIHNNNLSVYYLGSVFITVLSVIISWWYNNCFITKNESLDLNMVDKEEEYEEDILSGSDHSLLGEKVMSHIKTVRHSLAEEVAANLTEQQLKEEKEMEKQQLEAIFQLLQNQQDKYQVSSMEELEDQLRLYR